MKYLIGVVLILASCTVNKDLTTVKYSPTQAHPEYYLDVPKEYEFKGYEVTIEKERRYVYNDSSFVYIINSGIHLIMKPTRPEPPYQLLL